MINYEYLSCTDSDGNVKEINFCPDTLPDTADKETYTLLSVHADTQDDKLLHVKQISPADCFQAYRYNLYVELKHTTTSSDFIADSATDATDNCKCYITFEYITSNPDLCKGVGPAGFWKFMQNVAKDLNNKLLSNNSVIPTIGRVPTLPATGGWDPEYSSGSAFLGEVTGIQCTNKANGTFGIYIKYLKPVQGPHYTSRYGNVEVSSFAYPTTFAVHCYKII